MKEADIRKVLVNNEMEYAVGIIADRAIPKIDGLKPSQRRVLYVMKLNKWTSDRKAKCAKVAGQTMTYHPHGDATIYQTMVLMTDKSECQNIPYISGKGNFGKTYSDNVQCSQMRYTEAGLSKYGELFFDGFNEDAVKFVSNYDETEVEPTILPVKFPNIICNPISGVAVAKGCCIPSFNLGRVCDATIGIIKGDISNSYELAEVLKCPEFPTGGYVHTDIATMEQLCSTGKASFVVSGAVELYNDKIIVKEIPYNTKAEEIIDSATEHIKDKTLQEISDIDNEIGKDGLSIVFHIKRGYNSRKVLQKLCRYTTLRKSIHYNTMIIHDGECMELGVYGLLEKWIDFRQNTIKNIYNYRVDKTREEAYLMKAWEIVGNRLVEMVNDITGNKRADARKVLVSKYGLDEAQADYILDKKLYNVTQDEADKNIQKMYEAIEKVKRHEILASDTEEGRKARLEVICNELAEIKEKYDIPCKTTAADMLVESDESSDEVEAISSEEVQVVLTRNGYIKRLVTVNQMMNFEPPEGDSILRRWSINNDEYLLVFTCDGAVHKVLVDSIDSSRGDMSELLWQKLLLKSKKDILWAEPAGDYSSYFNLVYGNGRGRRVYFEKAAGNRKKYVGLFEPCKLEDVRVTKADKFFIITQNRKAAYTDLTGMGILCSRHAFKVATIGSKDRLIGIVPLSEVPDVDAIDIERYNKTYTVSIKGDKLWYTQEEREALELRKKMGELGI